MTEEKKSFETASSLLLRTLISDYKKELRGFVGCKAITDDKEYYVLLQKEIDALNQAIEQLEHLLELESEKKSSLPYAVTYGVHGWNETAQTTFVAKEK